MLIYAPNNLTNVRIGFVVSKRTSKLAVERNYIKRLLAEAIRPLLAEIPVGWDIILSAKQTSIGVPLTTLRQDLQILLRRARLYNPAPVQESQS
jgi:ribonuclease P protein component